MTRVTKVNAVVVVVGGPAGSAAALQIVARRPDVAAQTVVLDRSVLPRDGLCTGACPLSPRPSSPG